jgi:hypothetical protein
MDPQNINKEIDLSRLTSMIQQAEPVLKDPDKLTDEIMNIIEHDSLPDTKYPIPGNKQIRTLQIVQRLLAVASVCLLMIFSYEEFNIVNKISNLEKQNSAISSSVKNHEFNLEKAGMLFSSRADLQDHLARIKSEKPGLFTLLKAASYLQKNNEQ